MGLGDNIASGFADVAGDFVDVGKGIAHAVGDVIELEGDVGAAVIGGIAHTQQSVASTVLHGTEALIDTARSNVHHAAEAVADVTGDRDTKIRRTMSKNDPHGGRGRGHGNDSGVPIVVDPTIKQPIVDYYQEQSDAVARILDHVATYCNVDGSFGLLLGIFLKPNYIASRARTVEACQALKDAIEAVSDQFQGAMADMEQNEDSITSLLEKILRELEEARQNGGGSSTGGTSDTGTTSTTGGGGGYGGGGYGGGGYGGGGYGGGGGYPIPSYPEPTITDPSATDPAHVNVSVHVDADGNVDVDVDVDGSAADVDVDVDVDGNGDHSSIDDADTVDDATTSDAAAPTRAGGGGGGAGGGAGGTAEDPQELGMDPIDGKLPEIKTGDEQLTAEQLAERATYYDRIWTELAADDPLGRTPDELRLAWETREELKLDPNVVTGTTTLGYGETATFAKPTVDFGLIATPEGAAA